MKELQCKNIVLTNESTKICVPVTGVTESEIIEQASKIKTMEPDLVEWRADFYNKRDYIEMLAKLTKELGDIPVLFTFRTQNEGGERNLTSADYSALNKSVADASDELNVAFIDVELYTGKDDEAIKEIVSYCKDKAIKVIGSNHHFDRTPSAEKIVAILKTMEELGADVCKIAVMPTDKLDVEKLITASAMADEELSCPIITMSMSELGAVTRVATSLTKSCLTFAAGIDASAPGQVNIDIVKYLLKINKGVKLDCNIALIGFMGTGKTTISRALSKITGFEEVDVDKYIVDTEGMSINDMFEKYGEQYFRDIETKALKHMQETKGKIVSCGGGAVLRDENVDILKEGSVIVLLTATPETIFERVKDHTHRPILNNDMSIGHVKELMSAREPRYQAVADVKVNVDCNDRIITSYEILRQLSEMGKVLEL